MTTILLIDINGSVRELKAKDLTEAVIYKKCGLRTAELFTKQHTWSVQLPMTTLPVLISVWAKPEGKANNENKYEFPVPVDTKLFFGTCALVRQTVEGQFLDLTTDLWNKVSKQLFGGFEDIADTDHEDEDDDEDNDKDTDPQKLLAQTQHGYAKDGFVVDDDDEQENEDVEDSSSSETDMSDSEQEGGSGETSSETDTSESSEAEENVESDNSSNENGSEVEDAEWKPKVKKTAKRKSKAARDKNQKEVQPLMPPSVFYAGVELTPDLYIYSDEE